MQIISRATLALAGLAGLAAAQPTASIVIMEDDFYPPDIVITAFDSVAVNNSGSWVVQARFDDTSLLIKDDVVVGRQGFTVPEPPGATAGFFGGARLNNNGDMGYRLSLDNTSGANDDTAVFFNQELVIQEGQFSIAPDLTSSTRWIGFFNATTLNDLDQIFILGSVDDPNIASSVDRVLVRANYDAVADDFTEDAIAFESMAIDGQRVVELGTSSNQVAVNAVGDVMYFIDGDAPAAVDGMLVVNRTVVAREGQPSPVPGFTIESVASRTHDINDAGVWVARADLIAGAAPNDEFIFRSNGSVVAREGDAPPGLPGFALTGFGTGPVCIGNDGAVLWYGDWNDPDTSRDEGLFVNDTLLLREGDQLEGMRVVRIFGIVDGYTMSQNGRFVIARIQVEDPFTFAALDAVARFDRGETRCAADYTGSSDPNDPSYGVPDGVADLSDFFFYLDQFATGNLAIADLTGSSDPNDPSYGVPDGQADLSDFFYYLDRFVEGCP